MPTSIPFGTQGPEPLEVGVMPMDKGLFAWFPPSVRRVNRSKFHSTQEPLKMTFTSREKLNFNHVVGSVAVAAMFAALTGSGVVFIVVAGVMIAKSLASGDIRPARIGRR